MKCREHRHVSQSGRSGQPFSSLIWQAVESSTPHCCFATSAQPLYVHTYVHVIPHASTSTIGRRVSSGAVRVSSLRILDKRSRSPKNLILLPATLRRLSALSTCPAVARCESDITIPSHIFQQENASRLRFAQKSLDPMATCAVRFEFYIEGTVEVLKFMHNIPRSLVDDAPAQATGNGDAGYVDRYVSTAQPIVKEHQAVCSAAASPFCGSCGAAKVQTLQTPMSFLHNTGDPFVASWVSSVCGKGECLTLMRQRVKGLIDELGSGGGQDGRASGPNETAVKVISCSVCGKTGGTMRCSRCKVTAYCGKEHQKAHWKVHKKTCIARDGET